MEEKGYSLFGLLIAWHFVVSGIKYVWQQLNILFEYVCLTVSGWVNLVGDTLQDWVEVIMAIFGS